MEKKALPWIGVYALILALSLDYWNWNKATPLFYGIPYWTIVFIALNVLLCAYYLFFSRFYWRSE